MLVDRYHAKSVVLFSSRPADLTSRKINRGRKSALRKIVNDQASGGHAYDRRQQVNRAERGCAGHDPESG